MDVASLLLELYDRIPSLARDAVEGLGADQLTQRPSADANTIAWLVWHLTRVQDHHVAELLETDQIWVEDDWARFSVSFSFVWAIKKLKTPEGISSLRHGPRKVQASLGVTIREA